MEFKELVDEYYTPLYRFAYSLAKNEHEAGDLTQQTFFIYAEKGSSIKDDSKVKSWLFTTLYREFLRVRKRGQRMDSYENELLEAESDPVETDVGEDMDAGLAVEALQEVDPVYRVPLTLFYLQSHSYKEIADIMEVPIGTVMSRLSRGKSQLKHIFLQKDKMKSD